MVDVSLPRSAASLLALRYDGCLSLIRVRFEKWHWLPLSPIDASGLLFRRVRSVPSSANRGAPEALLLALLFLLCELGCSSRLHSVGAKKTSVCMGENRTNSPRSPIDGECSNPLNSICET